MALPIPDPAAVTKMVVVFAIIGLT